MKLAATIAAILLATVGCERAQSKLDKVPAPPGAPGAARPSGDLESRVARLEQYSEALDFLQKVYTQQKAQADAQEASEPAPDAVFAVDVREAIKAGQVEGPTAPMVTIIEAWDFA